MQPDEGQGEWACDEVGDDDSGGVEVPGQAVGGGGGAGTGSVEEFVAVAAFDGGVLDVFGAIGAFFHFIHTFCIDVYNTSVDYSINITENHGQGRGCPIIVVDKVQKECAQIEWLHDTRS